MVLVIPYSIDLLYDFTDSTEVTVSLKDMNDNPPIITSEPWQNILNTASGDSENVILTFDATDEDSGINKEFTFSMTPSSEFFELKSDGKLKRLKPLTEITNSTLDDYIMSFDVQVRHFD